MEPEACQTGTGVVRFGVMADAEENFVFVRNTPGGEPGM
jgi:hypothetical protein